MYNSPRDRYNRDPQFNCLVNAQVQLLEKCEFSPSEMRGAAVLACILYEERHRRIIGLDFLRHTTGAGRAHAGNKYTSIRSRRI